MPRPRLPFPAFYPGSHRGSKQIADPKEFWANVLYLARLVNGGLGVENLREGIRTTKLERSRASFTVLLDIDTESDWNPSSDPSGELLIGVQDAMILSSVTVLQTSPEQFRAVLYNSATDGEMATLDSLNRASSFTVNSFDEAVFVEGHGPKLDVVNGWCKGILLEFLAEHTE